MNMQKLAGWVVLIGVITAATLPGRQTPQVVNSIKNLATGVGHTVITGQQ